LELQLMVHARCLTALKAGSNKAAKMAMTTSNSVKVKALLRSTKKRDARQSNRVTKTFRAENL
jgi:hypothetical protein